ncbi:MAG: MGMT family protein [Gemmatimonadales bacterium]|jgi:methylated-DNA-protein-cysteine methyltransferase-like protein
MADVGTYERIYGVVRGIPKGRVATYGQVARLAGMPGHARQVGYALHALSENSGVPWHRVVNARGEVSKRAEPGYERIQRELLEAEGVRFDGRGRLSLTRYGWGSVLSGRGGDGWESEYRNLESHSNRRRSD